MLLLTAGEITASTSAEGLPLTRSYPLEEIGNVSQGGRLTYDRFGRLAVVQDGFFVVLNDTSWRNIAAPATNGSIRILQAAYDGSGTTYYGALGNWGQLKTDKTGNIHPQPLMPEDCPKWVAATNFGDILVTSSTVYFSGWNGIAAWNPASFTHQFFAVPEVAAVFKLGETLCVSSHIRGLLKIDAETATLQPVYRDEIGNTVINHCAFFGSGKALLSSTNRRLFLWSEGHITKFPGPLPSTIGGAISALQPLAEGDVALAILNNGIYIVGQDGEIKLALTGADYRHVTALAGKEPGVLWAMTETAVQKIFYRSPLTIFGQSLGIHVEWPQLVSWNDQTLIASGGHLYEPKAGTPGEPTQFQRVSPEPEQNTWGIATIGPWLLTANAKGVFARRPGSDFEKVLDHIEAARLVTTNSGACVVIGTESIAAIQYKDGAWKECAPRIDGVGFPSIVHAAADSVWIELGVNRVARVTLRSGKLDAQVINSFSQSGSNWVNVSPVGDTVVLAVTDDQRLFFSEKTETFSDTPKIKRVLAASPSPVYRLVEDDRGTLWASHARGLVTLTPKDTNYIVDATSYDLINEGVPMVHALPNHEIWVSTGASLYHVNLQRVPVSPPDFRPVIVSIRDSRANTELANDGSINDRRWKFSAKQNSLALTFFAGSYHYRHPPRYEFRLKDSPWKPVSEGSSLMLTDLYEGDYTLEVRLTHDRGTIGTTTHFDFSVEAPWYRAWYAFIMYPIIAGMILFVVIRYSVSRARARSKALEKLVTERTGELKATMEKLQTETITSAMLAERARLANEIHDSLEQGFTGLQFQLETTADFKNCSPEVKSGLSVALNMIAYSRNEVRHAVRNLHAPILDSADLATAVRHIVTQIAPDQNYATVTTLGEPRRLNVTVEHHLLRIAQEALTNVIKHANATRAEIVIEFREDEIKLSIRDNGCGFDPAVVLRSEKGHFGLPSFRSRASALGGALDIASGPETGTCITVKVPLQPSPTK